MPDQGQATYLGWLYFGNYDEWSQRTYAQLRAQCPQAQWYVSSYESGRRSSKTNSTHPHELFWSYLEVSLRRTVDPALIERIPGYDVVDVPKALRQLKRYAQPFELMKLPEHVRQLVFQLYFTGHASNNRKKDCYVMDECGVMEEKLPDLLSVQVYGSPLEESGELGPSIRRLAAEVLRDNLRLLKTVVLRYSQQTIEVGIDNKAGLRARFFNATCSKEWKNAILKHVEEVERDRKAMGLQGEGILLALTSKPHLWIEEIIFA